MRAIRFLVLGLALAMQALAPARQFFPAVVNPFTVTSPDGHTKLRVNPSNRYGRGKADYRATRDGKILWQLNLPYTLTHMVVTDGGIAAGAGNGLLQNRKGTKAITEIDTRGKVYNLDTLVDYDSQPVDASPAPLIEGVILDQDHDRFIVRTGDYEQKVIETWRTYSLAKAARTRVDSLESDGYVTRHYLLGAKYVAKTGCILLDWSTTTGDSAEKCGQTFSLIDDQMHEIWHADHSQDFELGKPVEAKYGDIQALRGDGCILETGQPGRFDVRLFRANLRVSYRFDGKVHQLAAGPYAAPDRGMPKMPSVKAITLHPARRLTIPKIGIQSGLVHDVSNIFVSKTRIVALLDGSNPSILLSRIDGTPIKTDSIPKQPEGNNLVLARSTVSKFVLISTDAEGPGHSHAWRVDVDKGTFTSLPKFKSFHVTAATGIPSGGFAVLSTENVPFSQDEHLSIYKADGTLVCDKRQAGSSGAPEELFSPEDLTVDSKGRIVVLENIENMIQFFKPNGDFVSMVRVPETRGKQYYLTHVAMEPDGSAWVTDMGDLLHVGRTGKLLSNSSPRRPDPKKPTEFDVIRCEAVGPDGLLLISDGFSIFRVSSSGVVTSVVGTKRASASLGEINSLEVGFDGRTYVQDRETGSVTVFDPSGQRLFTLGSGGSSGSRYHSFHLLPSGDVIVNASRYSHGGKPLAGGIKPADRMPKIERLPDLTWFRGAEIESPDGSLACIGGSESMAFGPDVQPKIGFYNPAGTPQSQIILPKEIDPRGSAAFDGQTIYLATKSGLLAIHRSGKFLWRFRPKDWTGNEEIFRSKGQIAVYDGGRSVIWYDLAKWREGVSATMP